MKTVMKVTDCPVCDANVILQTKEYSIEGTCTICGYKVYENHQTGELFKITNPYGVCIINYTQGPVVVSSMKNEEEYKDMIHSLALDKEDVRLDELMDGLDIRRYVEGVFQREILTREE